MSRLRNATIEALNQIRSLIIAVEGASGSSGDLYDTSGLGRHVRHVVDHFRALQAGVESGTVDYNVRSRDCALERQSDLGMAEIESLVSWLQAEMPTDIRVTVKSEISCLQTENELFQSNTGRELLYLINHTIHHAAYAALLIRQHGVVPAADVGLAPATRTYLRDSEAQAGRPRNATSTTRPAQASQHT